jgi:hypothetical protein
MVPSDYFFRYEEHADGIVREWSESHEISVPTDPNVDLL